MTNTNQYVFMEWQMFSLARIFLVYSILTCATLTKLIIEMKRTVSMFFGYIVYWHVHSESRQQQIHTSRYTFRIQSNFKQQQNRSNKPDHNQHASGFMVLAKKWLTNKLDMLLQTNKMAANILIRLIRSIRACYRLCPSNLLTSNLYKMAANILIRFILTN